MPLTRDDIIDQLVTVNKLHRREAMDILDTFIDDMKTEIEAGHKVKLAGFGALFLKRRGYTRKTGDMPEELKGKWEGIAFIPDTSLKAKAHLVDGRVGLDDD